MNIQSLSNTKVLLVVIMILISYTILHERRMSQNYESLIGNSMGTGRATSLSSLNIYHYQGDSCLYHEQDVDDIISAADRIFILTPGKSGGTSMKTFAIKCTNNNFLEFPNGDFVQDPEKIEEWLTHEYELPKIVSSHVREDSAVKRIASAIPSSSLLIYTYRNEEQRLKSAISHVVSKLCAPKSVPVANKLRAKMNVNAQDLLQDDGKCIVEEDTLIELIRQKQHEIGASTDKLLKCSTYDTFQKQGTNLLFMNYKQSNFLQDTLAKYHCPDEGHIMTNIADDREQEDPYVRLMDNSAAGGEERRTVDLNSWLEQKVPVLEWTLKGYSITQSVSENCKGKTKHVEAELLSCPTEFIRLPKFEH